VRITIARTDDGGVIVEAGCKTLVYSRKERQDLLHDLGAYLTAPERTIKEMHARHGWRSTPPAVEETVRNFGAGVRAKYDERMRAGAVPDPNLGGSTVREYVDFPGAERARDVGPEPPEPEPPV
jgi:hypothetical protein